MCKCPLCNNAAGNSVARSRGHSSLFQGRDLVQCSDCALVFIKPMPTDEELAAYNKSYFANAHGGLPTNPQAMPFFSGIARLRLRHMQSYLNAWGVVPMSVLEIGPGMGHLCTLYKAQMPNIDYAVVESDPGCHKQLHKLGARVFERIDQLDSANERFDLLIISHVLEHTSNPAAFLRPALHLIKPGGGVFIEVPCRDYEFKPQTEPHTLFFDKPSMQRLLTGLGLANLQLTYHGQEVEKLKLKEPILNRMMRRIVGWAQRGLIRFGLFVPVIDGLDDPAERAAVAPYEAHLIKEPPSWWLRAMARKN